MIGAWTWNDHLGMGFASEIGEGSALTTLNAAYGYMKMLCVAMAVLCLVGLMVTVVFNRKARHTTRGHPHRPADGDRVAALVRRAA